MIHLAFYKGNGNLFDRIVRFWTRSRYSHVEIVIGDFWYTSSPRDGGVVSRRMKGFDSRNWDFVRISTIPGNKIHIADLFFEQKGKRYDWLGIFLSQIFPLGVQNPKRWFCSEICAYVLDRSGANHLEKDYSWYSPGRLYEEVVS